MEEASAGHSLSLLQRQRLTMTGVQEVVSFDENTAVLQTEMGVLLVQGKDLKLKNLSAQGGKIAVDGTISALSYEEPRQENWLRRLWK